MRLLLLRYLCDICDDGGNACSLCLEGPVIRLTEGGEERMRGTTIHHFIVFQAGKPRPDILLLIL